MEYLSVIGGGGRRTLWVMVVFLFSYFISLGSLYLTCWVQNHLCFCQVAFQQIWIGLRLYQSPSTTCPKRNKYAQLFIWPTSLCCPDWDNKMLPVGFKWSPRIGHFLKHCLFSLTQWLTKPQLGLQILYTFTKHRVREWLKDASLRHINSLMLAWLLYRL